MKIYPVILCGGSGTRLWPLSRKEYPKQFLKLSSDYSMLQETILRLQGIESIAEPVIICNNDYRFIVKNQIEEIKIKNAKIVLEPVAKNTLPPIVAAALLIKSINPDDLLLVLPSDHTIKNIPAFHECIKKGMDAAKNNIVTFGVIPDKPETGYGYIKVNKIDNNSDYYPVDSFVEKPDLETAKKYLADGNYLWNSGMYMFSSKFLLEETKKLQPEILANTITSVEKSETDIGFIRLEKDSFSKNTSLSIDYGISEKSNNVKVIPFSATWNDIGTWNSLWEYMDKNQDNNYISGDVKEINTKNCYISGREHLIAASNLQDLIIVDTKDTVLIADKNHPDDIKNLFTQLNNENRTETIKNKLTYKPWGYISEIEKSANYKVQKIFLYPDSQLSLHYHNHRSEHWVVVEGSGLLTLQNDKRTIQKNESVYIPNGVIHSLKNESKESIQIIEIQTGDYLEEDDIIRIEDFYRREK